MSNLISKNSKSLKDINIGKTIMDVEQNNQNINNNSQNNLTKMVKYMNQTITNQKREPFRLIDEVKNNKYNNNINNTIVNITYINENKNYIKNVYNNDLLKPESKDKINIGIYDIRRIQQIIKNENIECYPIYIKSSDKTRLLRQLQREESPDCDEIIRRFIADKKDFIPVIYNTTGFDFVTVENNDNKFTLLNDIISYIKENVLK